MVVRRDSRHLVCHGYGYLLHRPLPAPLVRPRFAFALRGSNLTCFAHRWALIVALVLAFLIFPFVIVVYAYVDFFAMTHSPR